MSNFWLKYVKLCSEMGYNPTNAAKEIGLSTGTVSRWRHGSLPNSTALNKLSSFFNVSIEYLVDNNTDEEYIDLHPSQKTNKNKSLETFSNLFSIKQRFISLRHGEPINQQVLNKIAVYANTDIFYLLSDNVEYKPSKKYDNNRLLDHTTYDEILSLFDKCADDDNKKRVQVQLSRIVLYWLEKEFSIDEIKKWNGTLSEKIEYLKTNKKHFNSSLDYGFNFSEIDYFREKSIEAGKMLDFQYFLTGVKTHIVDLLRNEIKCLEKQLKN